MHGRYWALDHAEEFHIVALAKRNAGRLGTIRKLKRSDLAPSPARGSWEELAQATRRRLQCDMAEALECFRFACFPERYELEF